MHNADNFARAAYKPSGQERRLTYLDGLRGSAALMVFISHVTIALFPAVITGVPREAHTAYDQVFSFLPIAALWNGNFGVCIFFVLSGYVLSDFCSHSRISFPANVARRYFRLALPIFIVSIFAWALLVLSAYVNRDASLITRSGWLYIWYDFPSSFLAMAKEALYGAFATGSNRYNPNLWTMQIEFTGSLYIFLLFALFKSRDARLVVITIFALLYYNQYYVLFAAGAFFYEWGGNIDEGFRMLIPSAKRRERLALGLFALGFLLGGTPYLLNMPGARLLAYLNLPEWVRSANTRVLAPMFHHAEAVHEAAALLLFLGLLLSVHTKTFFSSTVPVFLGRISFTLYLVHIPLICSVLAWIVLHLPVATPYLVRALVAASITIAIALWFSSLINGFVDIKMTAFSRDVGRWLDRLFDRSAGQAVPRN